MAQPQGVTLNDKRIKELIRIYKGATRRIYQEVNTMTGFTRAQRLAVLTKVRGIIADLGVELDKWAEQEIPEYYRKGIKEAEADLRRLGVEIESLGDFTEIDQEAVDNLVNTVRTGFAETMRGIGRSVQNVLSEAQKLEINAILVEGVVTGAATRKIAREVKGFLQEQGLTGLRDKSGRVWQLDTYTNMLVRTTAVEARNRGLGNRMAEHGFDLVQVSDHNSDHEACAAWEGKILSYTGKTPGYPTFEQAKRAGLFHPNCKHAINAIDLGLAQQTKAYDNPPNTPSDATETNSPIRAVFKKDGTDYEFEMNELENKLVKERKVTFVSGRFVGMRAATEGAFSPSSKKLYIVDPAKSFSRNTFYHEMGHAFDYLAANDGSNISASKEFREAYKADGRYVAIRRLDEGRFGSFSDEDKLQLLKGQSVNNRSLLRSYVKYILNKEEIFAEGYAHYRLNPESFRKNAPKLTAIYDRITL